MDEQKPVPVLSGQLPLALEWEEGSYERYMDVFGKVVRLTVPVEWWSAEWHAGMRAKVYVGKVVSHSLGGCCVQTPVTTQGENPPCYPLKNNMTLEVLPGKLADY